MVYVDDALSTKIHTSCSQPIGPGLVFGDFIVVEGSSLKGGPLCPFDTPPGDEDCGPCKGKVTELTLRYTGADAFVEVVQKKDNAVVYGAELDSGDAFTFSGQDKDGTLGTEIKVFVNSSLNATIHTSCSKPIGPGLVFGDFEVVAGQSKDGGPLCIGGDGDEDLDMFVGSYDGKIRAYENVGTPETYLEETEILKRFVHSKVKLDSINWTLSYP